ncbi:MAG: response regulator [Kiritimatiellae bacterium]|nr:response regulator [Kiritimatiellia bacterium]
MNKPKPMQILLVDHDPSNLLSLEAMLEDLDHPMVRVNSGEEALRILQEQDIALILMDVHMSGIDGIETAQLIRSREATLHTPIIFITGESGSEEIIRRAYALGGVDYLIKPLVPEILRDKVHTFMAKQYVALSLIQSERSLLRILEQHTDGVLIVNDQDTIVYFNDQAGSLLKQSEDQLKKALFGRAHQRDTICELELVNASEELKIVEMRSMEIEWKGDPALLITLRDITQEKKINSMKTEFVSVASHELRTPLSNITEAVSQVIDGLYGEVSQEQQAILGIAHRNCKRLGRLIRDLLDISRIESGKVVFNRIFVDVGTLFLKVCDSFKETASERKIELIHEVGGDVPLAFADADRLEQVLVNLIGNAFKFTPSGGRIAVKAGIEGGCIRCVVSDTGIGMSPEQTEKIFEKFESGNSAAHGGDSGTGLGLAIAQQLVRLHGGDLWAESELGQGSQLIFRLPDYQSEVGLLECLAERIAKADAGHTRTSLMGISLNEWPELQARYGAAASLFFRKLGEVLTEGIHAEVNVWCLEDSGELVIVSDACVNRFPLIQQEILYRYEKYRFLMNQKPMEFGLRLATVCHPCDAAGAPQLRGLLRERVSNAILLVNTPKTVLIVDDEKHIVQLFERYFQHKSIRVIKAYNGEQALELAARDMPDLILLDMVLPGISGYEVIECLKEKIGTSHIPKIIVTGTDVTRMKIDEGQISIPVLRKPIEMDTLFAQVYKLLDMEEIEVSSP